MEQADYQQLNGIALAYLGDAVYEVFIRQHLLALGMSKPNRLQKRPLTTFRLRPRRP